MHENVMAVMMNTLGRRAQAQSQPGGTTVTGQDGEIVPKEKVMLYNIISYGYSYYIKEKKIVIKLFQQNN